MFYTNTIFSIRIYSGEKYPASNLLYGMNTLGPLCWTEAWDKDPCGIMFKQVKI